MLDEILDDDARRFLSERGFPAPVEDAGGLGAYWETLPWGFRDLCGWTLESLRQAMIDRCAARGAARTPLVVDRLEVLPGRDKSGAAESFELIFRPGDVTAIVGPTGSGKSRLLADIECLAQADTPSLRVLRVNGNAPDRRTRFTAEGRLVAQITQNMNFVMDLRALDFLRLHAESRGSPDPDGAAAEVLEAAVSMAGEPFSATTPLTQLSGGQSRALMIADAALLSPKPVVLLDEIENAGVDRARSLALFTDRGKIVLLSTHDPLTALSGDRRIVIRNGGVAAVVATTEEERGYAAELAERERRHGALRHAIRTGAPLASAWVSA